MDQIKNRLLSIELPKGKSAFLWGPRKVGKSFWLRTHFRHPNAKTIDLLRTDIYAEYLARPALLRERWKREFIIIDEIQKIPALLDEVHWLIENRGAQFLLTGSSARKLRRGHANMLGGRAWRYEMGSLCFPELVSIDLEKILFSGLLPPHYLSPDPKQDLRAYVSDYLKEEIAAEALVENIPAFNDFLRIAALTNSELLNYTNIAREVGVSAKVVRRYFEILEDTLLGFRLQPWKKSTNRRMVQTEKFYYFDVGVANFLAKRSPEFGSSDFGKSFEHYILMELLNFRRYNAPELEIHFWRTASRLEVDFVIGDMELAIEVKAKERVSEKDCKNLALLMKEEKIHQAIVVSLEKEIRTIANIKVMPFLDFLKQLWAKELF